MKWTVLAIIISLGLVIGAASLTTKDEGTEVPANNNVGVLDNKQIVEISAKGGYSPRKSVAKAGVPTILRVNTKGTFDCSIALRIPSLGLSKNLPPTAETDIDLGIPSAGILRGVCAMGMYYFEIDFQA
ncbi:MAG: cupredoxin domain-containing protein [Candidatus Paceibacterota bacterium]|jgi:plastocyanin domain-containing protein